MTLPRQHVSSSRLPAVSLKDAVQPKKTRRELEREVADKMREVQERTKEVSDGIRAGQIDIDDFADD